MFVVHPRQPSPSCQATSASGQSASAQCTGCSDSWQVIGEMTQYASAYEPWARGGFLWTSLPGGREPAQRLAVAHGKGLTVGVDVIITPDLRASSPCSALRD